MVEQEVWKSFRESRHEETRIAYLYLALIPQWIRPDTHVTFVGPGDYIEVGGWSLAMKVVNGEASPRPVMNVVERPERSWGHPQTVNDVLLADYLVEMPRVCEFFERTHTGLVIVRNPPYITNTQAYKKAFIAMMSWAMEHNTAMFLTLRRGETDDELEQALSGSARRLDTPMTADHFGDDEVIFLCE